MLKALSESLQAFLLDALGAPAGVVVAFDRPADHPQPPERPTLNLFLFDVQENTDYRSAESLVIRTGAGVRVGPSPVHVDCQYLVTARPSADDNTALGEHELLGHSLTVLARHTAVPDQFLKGELKTRGVHVPLRVGLPGRVRTFGEFWAAVGAKARASFTVTATAPLAPLTPAPVDVVRQHEVQVRPHRPGAEPGDPVVTLFHIVGRVVTAVGVGVPNAQLILAGLGREATTAADGSFRFDGLPPGEHPGRVVATGINQPVVLVVPSLPGPNPYTLRLT